MLKTQEYSLWLMPSGEIYERLNSLISQLSRKYKTPVFEPHLTLLGGVLGSEADILSKTNQLTSVLQPYRIELSQVEYLAEYFRCLFIKAKETDEVMNANLEARKIFDRQNDTEYMPHLSLMYGDFPPRIKEEIIEEIGKEISVSFDVSLVHLFSTTGEPKDWYRVGCIDLVET
jgi:2'-5' RNA ligase